MNKTINLCLYLVLISLLFINSNCKKDTASTPVPVVTTSPITAIGVNSAFCGGVIISDNGSTVIARGVCWSKNPTPTISDSKTIDGAGAGSFNSIIQNLDINSSYFVRAYATSSAGTGYGSALSLNTVHVDLPTASISDAINIRGNSVKIPYGINDGGSTVSASGLCYSTSPDPTISDNVTVNQNITGILPNTNYYVKSYATNIAGTSYSDQISFNSGYLIGSIHAGGLVFYNDGFGHGFVCASIDQASGSAPWGCLNTYLGAGSYDLGSGLSNTMTIISNCSEPGIAARLCYDLVLEGYDDWYLPSFGELKLMHTNLDASILPDYYWSSSENSAYYAWSSASEVDPRLKEYGYSVRAARTF